VVEKKAVVKQLTYSEPDAAAAPQPAVRKDLVKQLLPPDAALKRKATGEKLPATKKASVMEKTAVVAKSGAKNKDVIQLPVVTKPSTVGKKAAVGQQPPAVEVIVQKPVISRGTAASKGRPSLKGQKPSVLFNGHASDCTPNSSVPASPSSTNHSPGGAIINDIISPSLTNGNKHGGKDGLTFRQQTDGGSWTKHFRDLSRRDNSCVSPQLNSNSCPSSPLLESPLPTNLIERHKMWLMSPGSRPVESPAPPQSPPKKKIKILQSIAYK